MNEAALSAPTAPRSSKLSAGLWTVQILLALAFGASGLMKATTPIADLAQKLPWVVDMPGLTRFIGVSEILGALGLILPAATRIQPKLTALAAAALTLVMVLAAGFHLSRGEAGHLAPNVVLGGFAAFVAWGRFKAAPITSR